MTADASLKIRVEAGDVKNATGALDKLTSAGGRTEKAMGSLIGKVAGLAGAVAMAASAASKLVQTQRQFDVLNAGLITATKSVDGAAEAFAELEKFAATTPYTLDQSVKGFTKLVNLGLTPSQKAMESYGNTAAAMGKDLNQMIEAVADASTGEFERLKEFGIKSKSEGDKVSFTFQGVTTTVKKNADEIEQYLMKLGETQFAGAMANRMATLDGALSNLQDSWDSLFRAVSAQGTGGLIEDAARAATDALDELKAMLVSGELAGYAEAMGVAWGSTFSAIGEGLSTVGNYLNEEFKAWKGDGKDAAQFLSDAFWQFPQNISALVKIAASEISAFVDKTKIYADKINAYLTPENWFSGVDIGDYFDQQLTKVDQRVSREYAKINATYRKEIAATDQALREATDRRLDDELEALIRGEVNLSKFKVGGVGGGDDDKPPKPPKTPKTPKTDKFDTLKSQAAQYLQQIARDSMTEQQIVSNDYAIKLAKLDEYLAQKAITQQEYDAAELASREAFVDQMAVLDAKQTDAAIKEEERLKQAKKQIDEMIIGNTQFMLQATTDMIRDSGAENNTFMKMLLAAQKAFAIPSIMASTETAASAAMMHDTVLGGMMSGQMAANMIRAQGAISMGIVAGQAFAGMFDSGGYIPSGKWGIGAEKRDEFINGVLVKGPARITGGAETERKINAAAAGGGGGGLTIIQNFHMTEAYGNEAIYNIVGESAKKSVQEAYNKVRHDFATNGTIRRTAGV